MAMVARAVNAIITAIGYCVVIKGFLNGSLINDIMYYLRGIEELLAMITTITTGT